MKPRWTFCLPLLCCFFSIWAQDNDQDIALLPDTLNTDWSTKYEPSAKNHTNAVIRIAPDALCPAGNSFLTNGLYGIVPGALIQSTGFQPGTPPSVHIRDNRSPGMATLIKTADNFTWDYAPFTGEPIYLLDGMQVDAQWFGGLNPDEIESVEVIRNLAGTVGYGQTGINGVIQVKTKHPQKRGTSLIYNGYWGWQKPVNVTRPMNGAELAGYIREAYRNSYPTGYLSPTPSITEDQKIYGFTFDQNVWESLQMGYDSNGTYNPGKVHSTNWTDLVSQTGSIQEQTLTLLHGTEKVRLTAAGNYFSNTGTVKGTGYDRYSARILIEGELIRWLSIGAQAWGTYTERKLKGSMYTDAFTMNPLAVPYDSNGEMIGRVTYSANPLLYLDNYNDKTNSYMLSGRLYAAIHPVEGLNINLAYLPQVMNNSERINDSRNPESIFLTSNNASVDDTRNISTWEFAVSYQKKIQQHLLGASVSGSFKEDGFVFDYSRIRLRGGETQSTTYSYSEMAAKYKYYLLEFFYQWNDQLFFNFLGRWGKEELSLTDEKPSNFNPAISAAYNFIGAEGRSNRVLNKLNLRAAYGKDNNIQLVSITAPSSSIFDTYTIPIKNKYSEWNIGLDHAWIKHRLSGSIDYYTRKNQVSFISLSIPGGSTTLSDYMDIKNSGIEISLSSINIRTSRWQWISSLMVSKEKEKIQLASGIYYYNGNIADGAPLYSYRDYRYERLWQDTPADKALMEKYDPWSRPGEIKIANTNGDDRLDAEDRTVLGSPSPKWYGSLYNSVSYRGLELSFLLYTRQKFTLDTQYSAPSYYANAPAVDYWTPSNTGAHYPRPMYSGNLYSSALRYEDASFVRLQYVSLAWSLPQRWISLLRVSQLKVYVTVQNPVLFTSFSQSDPEGAATVGAVPGNTTWLLGVKLGL